ncbi:MAG: hypothetical protein ABSF45_12490 [Terriglobia bacterium]|jgi:hypothetical protein
MTDYSHAALGGTGREPEEKMRVFLGCEKADDKGYDFSKGRVKFEYKHSSLHERNKHTKEWRSAPTRSWEFGNLRGHGGKKDYDYLILEGEAEAAGDSYLFLISFKELCSSFPTLSKISVTLRLGGGKGRPLGKNSKFVWDHAVTKDELKARVDQYAGNSEDTEGSLRGGFSVESHESARDTEKDDHSEPNYVESPRRIGRKSTVQFPLPFKS